MKIGDPVLCPRSAGGEVLATIRDIDDYGQAFVSWMEMIPSNVMNPEAFAMSSSPPCVRMVEAIKGKWIALSRLTPIKFGDQLQPGT
jgi:hypothetical protein